MMYTITVQGHWKTWVFDIGDADPGCVEQWREDGLVIDETICEEAVSDSCIKALEKEQ